MKLLLIAASFLLVTTACIGQEKNLPLDERGKIIYYEVVEAKTVPPDSLLARAIFFLKQTPKTLKIDSLRGDTAIKASGKLAITKNALSMARPLGEMAYNLYVEVKKGKYRFWLTDFTFVPYTRDRYGNFVPANPIGSPIERDPGKLAAAEWAGYRKITAREATAFAEKFKKAMATNISIEKSEKPKNTISTRNW